MTKKVKEVKEKTQLTLDGIKTGMTIPDLHGKDMKITDDLIEQMRRFEKDTKKSAIWRNVITGSFLYYKWTEENPQEKKVKKPKKVEEESIEEVIEESLDEAVEEQVVDEENELLDAMEDYKSEYHVKSVRANSQKFKQFFYKWKQENQ